MLTAEMQTKFSVIKNNFFLNIFEIFNARFLILIEIFH